MDRLPHLFNKYLHNQCSSQEMEEFFLLLNEIEEEQIDVEMRQVWEKNKTYQAPSVNWDKMREDIIGIQEEREPLMPAEAQEPKRLLWVQLLAAAVILISLSIATYLYIQRQDSLSEIQSEIQLATDVAPGGNKATLILADGQSIDLSDSQEGIIIGENGIKYADNSFVISTEVENSEGLNAVKSQGLNAEQAVRFLSLSTPVGGQYKITLPDGTKVWLNSSSILKYPNQFTGPERRVELSGEAYFEVASNKKKPFKVSSANQEVTVLGTQFNISAYPDEQELKTTLLEGSVEVSLEGETKATKLRPNQQSIVTGASIAVKTINPETVIAWKNGEFVFGIDDFRTTMRKIARWYDVEIVYDPSAPQDVALGGWVSRNKNLSSVLNVMEKSGKVRFQISPEDSSGKGRRITVMK